MVRSTTLMLVAAGVAAMSYAGRLPAASASEHAVMHFADLNGIRDWRPDEDGQSDAILIEGLNGQWYRATFWSSCPEINFVPGVAFVTDTLGNLDRFTSIIADGHRCYFRTFQRTSDPDK
jgi:hypothetical protein